MAGGGALGAETGALPRSGWRACLALLLLALASCGDGSQPDSPDMPSGGASGRDCPSDLPSRAGCDTDVPSYRLEVAPIVEQRCLGCHFAGNTQSGNVLVEHADVYRQRQTVLTRIYACVMPPAGALPLGADERQVLLEWLVCGAPDN